MGTEGRAYFDCSGLVCSVYKRAGLVDRIGGGRRGATRLLRTGPRRHGRVSRHNPRWAMCIIWGMHGKVHHSGIYIGNGRAISACSIPSWGAQLAASAGSTCVSWASSTSASPADRSPRALPSSGDAAGASRPRRFARPTAAYSSVIIEFRMRYGSLPSNQSYGP